MMWRWFALSCLVLTAGASGPSDQPLSVALTGLVRYVTPAGAIPYPGDAVVVLTAAPSTGASPGESQPVLAATRVDATGHFAFFGLSLIPGTYAVSATLEQSGAHAAVTFTVASSAAGTTIDRTIDVSPFVAPTRGAPARTDPFVSVPVFYATDRQLGANDAAGAEFLNQVSVPYAVTYGQALVTIPRTHERGQLEGSDVRIQLRADKANHIILQSVSVSPSEAAFYHDLRANLDATKSTNAARRIIVYIHGYWNSFDHAIRTAAQIKFDLEPVPSTMILYSWPSKDSVFGYFDDEDASANTIPALRSFLVSLARESGGAEINVIAHSMGNSALVGALEQLANDPSVGKPLLNNVIMAAPDVPAAVLANDSCKLAALSNGMTLYASSHDQALLAATAIAKMQNLRGFHPEDPVRAGLEDPLLIAVGLDTVDASSASTDFIGHGYFSHDVDILSDIQQVLVGDPPPRAHLVSKAVAAESYWLFIPKPVPAPPARVRLRRCAPGAR